MTESEHSSLVLTALTSHGISSVERASSYFSDPEVFESLASGEQPILLNITRKHLWAYVPEGLYVLTSSWGVISKTPAKAGLMLLPIWKKIVCVIPKHYIPVDVPIKLCPTLDNVMIQVDIIIVIHIEDPYAFYINIGPSKLQHIVSSFVEETIRSLCRTITYYEAYDIRNMDPEGDMIRSLNEKMETFGVVCSDITITDIFIPRDLKESMEKTTGYQSSTRAHNREHEFEEKKLEYQEFRIFENLKHQNQRFAYDTETQKLVNMIQKETDEIDALTTKSVSEISSKQYGEVLEISSKAKLESAKLDGEKIKFLYVTLATGKKDSSIVKANEWKYTDIIHSQIVLNVAENKSKALLLISKAEEQSKDKMRPKREDKVKRAQIAVINSLSENQNLHISGSSSDDKFAQILGTQSQSSLEDAPNSISSHSNKRDLKKDAEFEQQQKMIETLQKEIYNQKQALNSFNQPKEEEIKIEEMTEEEEEEDFFNYANPAQFKWIGSRYAFLMRDNGSVCVKKERTGWNFVAYSSSVFTEGKFFFEVRVTNLNDKKLMAVGLSTEMKMNSNSTYPNENLVVCLDGHQHNLQGENGHKGNSKTSIGMFVDMDIGCCRFFMNGMLLNCYAKLDKKKQYRCCVHMHDNEDEVNYCN
eukprot:gene2072-1944_t